mmetsp:Transcript_556/g.2126  ORF Transcript_556/g.2126 Transcript_556/m.2126 type:complete len:88 (-) Transcript_556:3-266(-)
MLVLATIGRSESMSEALDPKRLGLAFANRPSRGGCDNEHIAVARGQAVVPTMAATTSACEGQDGKAPLMRARAADGKPARKEPDGPD